jgi:ABC-type nitrate/sulfonate/bicarbonate transport system substrate-binding protein
MVRTHSRGARLARLVAALAALVVLAACGSGGGDQAAAPGGRQSLTIAVGGSSIVLSDLVVALDKGFINDQNLDVTLQYLGVPSAQAALAGQVDLAYSTPTQTFSAIAAGRDVKTIWSSALVNSSLTIAVPAGSTAAAITDLSGKSIATYPPGSASYGNAVFLSDQIVAQGGQPLQIRALGDATAIGTQLAAGQVDAGMAAGDFFSALVAQNKVRILADPRQFQSFPQYNFVNSGMFGLASTLTDKHDAVQRLITAMNKAAAFITTSPSADTAAVLNKSTQGDYSHQSVADLTRIIDASNWFLDKSAGCVTEPAWSGTLLVAKGFNLPLNGKTLDDPIFGFGAAVDNSFAKGAGAAC